MRPRTHFRRCHRIVPLILLVAMLGSTQLAPLRYRWLGPSVARAAQPAVK